MYALIFTFHYVSITTYLSIRLLSCLSFFTFHYVSITTKYDSQSSFANATLHSTMSLLLLGKQIDYPADTVFTFHYVSITTVLCQICRAQIMSFTFHYVSITTTKKIKIGDVIVLYIPLCLYYYRLSRTRQDLPLTSLHSTMSLLLPGATYVRRPYNSLYIPLCLYLVLCQDLVQVKMRKFSPF